MLLIATFQVKSDIEAELKIAQEGMAEVLKTVEARKE